MAPPVPVNDRADPPPSATSIAITAAGYATGAGAMVAMGLGAIPPVIAGLISLAIIAAILAAGDLAILRVHRRPSAGLAAPGPIDPGRIAVKLLALAATLAVPAALYAVLLPLAGDRFVVFMGLMPLGVFALMLAPAYFLWADRRMADPQDGYWHIGQLLLGRIAGRNWGAVRTYLLGWIIKGFFLPIMTIAFFAVAGGLVETLSGGYSGGVTAAFGFSFTLILFIDLAVAVLGYIFTFRLLDTHIRSCNPLWYGWVATLACYYPFWGILFPSILGYSDGRNWDDWFAGAPALLIAWGGLILLAKVFWVWANATFGLRFSNLTHRGILTGGPFRLTKHPSYVSKNIAWWLISLPFLSQLGWQEALPNCMALLFVNAIYIVRAKIEERHLSSDPVYVAYAAWIAEHGLFARLARLIPIGRVLATPKRI